MRVTGQNRDGRRVSVDVDAKTATDAIAAARQAYGGRGWFFDPPAAPTQTTQQEYAARILREAEEAAQQKAQDAENRAMEARWSKDRNNRERQE